MKVCQGYASRELPSPNSATDSPSVTPQGMMDFDFVCSRKAPSVQCMIYPFTGDHKQKFYWGHKEILVPGTSRPGTGRVDGNTL